MSSFIKINELQPLSRSPGTEGKPSDPSDPQLAAAQGCQGGRNGLRRLLLSCKKVMFETKKKNRNKENNMEVLKVAFTKTWLDFLETQKKTSRLLFGD